MPPLPVVSGLEARKAFERAGWIFRRQAGSHMIMAKPGFRTILSIPNHRTLDRGTLRSLISDSGMTVEEFLAYMR